jgi:hypothetical protein
MDKNKNIGLKQNDSKRMVVKCVKGCPFHIRFSKRIGNQFWQLVSLVDDHNCNRIPQNKQAKTEWLAKKFMHTLRVTPDMKPKGLVAEAIDKWGVKLSLDQAYRAKRRAIELIEGAGREQFSHLRTYANELLKSNRNSTVIIKCVDYMLSFFISKRYNIYHCYYSSCTAAPYQQIKFLFMQNSGLLQILR